MIVKSSKVLALGLSMILCSSVIAIAESDKKGSADHPLFTRMPNMYIQNYKEADFEQAKFPVKGSKPEAVEGRLYKIAYKTNKGAEKPGPLEIVRNHTAAIAQIGGKVLFDDGRDATMTLVKDGKEIWAKVDSTTGQYTLTIVEKKAMTQAVTSNAIFDALEKDGFMVIDVHFDFGKATIRPESQPLIDQIVEMMKRSASLKVSVEGHTDNVGDPKSNKSLSTARAKAVLEAVVKSGVGADRMSAIGWGEEKPVADNKTEEGRAKNRRVALVKIKS
ncbi:MAG: OmpA family protein [Nitrospinae bacterium]|nr:OmpA family protein [Nitrospinota bacterium]MBF0634078.1 OmpA family protein [Nitrospinota bacterium]